jgi:acyl transferase domain-containing protein
MAADPCSDVLLFPGHARYSAQQLRDEVATTPGTAEILGLVDQVAVELGSPRPLSPAPAHGPESAPSDTADAETDDLLAFAVSLARYRTLEHCRPRRSVLLGHSFGHLAALTCAGAFSLEDAARLLLHRNQAIRTLPAGRSGMACIELSAQHTRKLLRDVDGDDIAVACHNTPNQTVVGGPVETLSRLRRRAVRDGILYVRLPSEYAFHTCFAEPAVTAMRAAVREIPQRPLRQAVFSATLGRYCSDDDDLVTEMVLDLVRPVRFLHAVRRLQRDGADTFVDCGPTAMLTRLVFDILPDTVIDVETRTARIPKAELIPTVWPGICPAITSSNNRKI